jgi:hypothetical protein
MSATLELPPLLREEVEYEAQKEGIPPSDQAVLLLYIVTALLREPERSPFQRAVRDFFEEHALDASQVASVFEDLVHHCLHRSTPEWKGGVDESRRDRGGMDELAKILAEWRNSAVHRPAWNEVSPSDSHGLATKDVHQGHRLRPTARGKYAHLHTSSDAFAERKQDEIDREGGSGK